MVRLRGMCPQSIISCAAHDSLEKACREGSSSGIWYGACSEDSRASGSARFRTFGQLPTLRILLIGGAHVWEFSP